MPHITVEMLPGRTEETKQKLVQKISKTVADCVCVDLEHVSVSIKEVRAEEWTETVLERILKEKNCLYKSPSGY